MNNRLKISLPFLTLLVLAIGLTSYFYGFVLQEPNHVMFSNSGDGIKNYYTYAYHITHDSSYTELEGMNYPYGENYLYTDCHPILANTLKALSSVFPGLSYYSLGILNLLLIGSIFLTYIVVYFLLRHVKISKWFSVFFSLSITLLAPQLFRLGGHLALSYSFAIPLTWLLSLRYIRNPNKAQLALLLTNNLVWMFVHAYLGIIIVAFQFALWGIQLIMDGSRRKRLFAHFGLLATIITPVILFFIYAKLTDSHDGRTTNPSGFFLYNAELDDLLIPHGKPFRSLFDLISGGTIKLEWEARGYMGLVNSLLLVGLILLGLLSLINQKVKNSLQTVFSNKQLNVSMIAGVVVLLFAMAVPFRQFPSLLEYLPVFKQFRATGRFVWPFYFAFTVLAVYVFQSWFQLSKTIQQNKLLKFGLLGFILGLSYWEGIHYHKQVAGEISQHKNVFLPHQLSEDLQSAIEVVNSSEYQAIISLPFFYQGSESYGRPRNEEAVKNTLVLSYHTGIPTVGANLTRTSVEESKRIVQLISPDYYSKPIKQDFPNKKSFLLLVTGDELTVYERMLLRKGKLVFQGDEFRMLEVSFEELFQTDQEKLEKRIFNYRSEFTKRNTFYVNQPNGFLYFNDYETTLSDTVFSGEGSFTSIKKGKNVFAEFPPGTFESAKNYEFSLWMYNGEPDALNLWFRVMIEAYNETTQEWHTTTIFPEHAEVINGNWTLVEGTFSVQDPKNRIYVVSKGKKYSKAKLHADDLLIKAKGLDVYMYDESEKSLFYNNHRVKMDGNPLKKDDAQLRNNDFTDD